MHCQLSRAYWALAFTPSLFANANLITMRFLIQLMFIARRKILSICVPHSPYLNAPAQFNESDLKRIMQNTYTFHFQ